MSPILRLHAVCDAREPICPKCSNVIVGKALQKPDGTVWTCLNRHEGGTCGQHVVTLATHGMVVVVAIEQGEFRLLLEDERSLKDGLRELDILIGRVA